MTLPAEQKDSPWPEWVNTWVMPYILEEALWPVLVAFLGHVIVAIAPMLLYVVRDRSVAAGALLFVMLALTAYPPLVEVRALRRPGAVTVVFVLIWCGSALIAWIAGSYGLL